MTKIYAQTPRWRNDGTMRPWEFCAFISLLWILLPFLQLTWS